MSAEVYFHYPELRVAEHALSLNHPPTAPITKHTERQGLPEITNNF